MGNMNRLISPVFDYLRQDGRPLKTVSRLDFCQGALQESADNERHLLSNGLLVGAIIRYHWGRGVSYSYARPSKYSSRSLRLHLLSEYSGEETDVGNMQGRWPEGRCPEETPLFNAHLWRDDGKKIAVGEVAIAYLREGQTALVAGMDHAIIRENLGLPEETEYGSHLKTVQIGGLYYVPGPVQPQTAG